MNFSVKTLLAAFALCALIIAALVYPNGFLLSVFTTAAVALILIALLAALLAHGSARAYWIGFALFAIGYFTFAFFVHRVPLLTSQFLLSADNWLNTLLPMRFRQPFSLFSHRATEVVGHSVFTILVGLFGGWLAERLYHRQTEG